MLLLQPSCTDPGGDAGDSVLVNLAADYFDYKLVDGITKSRPSLTETI